MKILAGFSPLARAILVAAAIAIVVIFVQAAASIVAPMLLAVFIAIVATPPLNWMRSKGVPKYLALAVIVLVLLDVGSLFALISTGALEGFQERLPSIRNG